MGRIVDITDKLTFEGNPSLKVKEKLLEINADAPTVLKVMGLMSNGEPGNREIIEAYNLIFPEKSQKEIIKLKINFKDMITLIQEAIQLIAGEEQARGEG